MIRVVDTRRTVVVASAAAVPGPPATQGRIGFTCHNNSPHPLRICYGGTAASSTVYDEPIEPGMIYETPADQCVIGAISCIWLNAAPTGAAYFSERIVNY